MKERKKGGREGGRGKEKARGKGKKCRLCLYIICT